MTELKPYQIEGARQIYRFNGRALLADSMGLGKTIQALYWIVKTPKRRPVVIVCPAGLRWTWQAEAALHFNLRVEVLEGREPPQYMDRLPGEIVAIGYDILSGWVKLLRKFKPQTIIFDEIHYTKCHTAQRSRAAKKLTKGASSVIGLSGTPLTNRPIELWSVLHLIRPDIFPDRNTYAWKFCLEGNAPILMADLTEKPISKVRRGDLVIGWKRENTQRRLCVTKVLNVLQRSSPLQKVILMDGTELICSPDHEWSTGASHKGFEYSIAKIGRNGGGGKGCASQVMKVMRAPKQSWFYETDDYKLGYIHGVLRGDGHCVERINQRVHLFKNNHAFAATRKYVIGCAMKDESPMKRLSSFLSHFGIYNTLAKRSDGLTKINSLGNKKTYSFLCQSTHNLHNTDDWWAGFLGGIYDAEGSDFCIHQSKKQNSQTYNMIGYALKRFNFQINYRPSGSGIRMYGGKKELFRFWEIASPSLTRKLLAASMSKGGATGGGVGEKRPPRVSKIIPIHGIHKTYTLTTETGNYVAYGCGSKNCSPRYTPWGWRYDGAENTKLLHSILKRECMIRRLKKDVLKDLPDKLRRVISLKLPSYDEYEKAQNDFLHWLRTISPSKATKAKKGQALVKVGYLLRLVAHLKSDLVKTWMKDFFSDHPKEKLMALTMHTGVINTLRESFPDSVVVDARVIGRKRADAVRTFQNNPRCPLLIGNWRAAGIGITLTSACYGVALDMPWTPGDLLQGEDRLHRIGQKRKVMVFYLIAINTIEEKLMRILLRKSKVLDAVLNGNESARREVNLFDELLREFTNI